jgi:hypothetical protein
MAYIARAHLDRVTHRRDWVRRSTAALGRPYPTEVLGKMEYNKYEFMLYSFIEHLHVIGS